MNDIIKDSLKLFEQECIQKAIHVETDLKDDLPMIIADKKLLKRAFCNIIKNSIEAMEIGKKILKITSRMSGDNLEIQFSDTGIGISKDKIKNIFDPLVTSKIYGPGLGLTFALKIVQDHKGTISVESEPGKGTTFTIIFPVKTG